MRGLLTWPSDELKIKGETARKVSVDADRELGRWTDSALASICLSFGSGHEIPLMWEEEDVLRYLCWRAFPLS